MVLFLFYFLIARLTCSPSLFLICSHVSFSFSRLTWLDFEGYFSVFTVGVSFILMVFSNNSFIQKLMIAHSANCLQKLTLVSLVLSPLKVNGGLGMSASRVLLTGRFLKTSFEAKLTNRGRKETASFVANTNNIQH